MRQTAIVGIVTALTILGRPGELGACGDKLLSVGGLYSYSRPYAATNPGAVVLYLPGAASKNPGHELASALRRVGHDVAVVTSREALDTTIAAGSADVVVVNASNLSDALIDAVGTDHGPLLLPVVFDKVPAHVAAAHLSRFATDLSNEKKGLLLLYQNIDAAMASRPSRAGIKKH